MSFWFFRLETFVITVEVGSTSTKCLQRSNDLTLTFFCPKEHIETTGTVVNLKIVLGLPLSLGAMDGGRQEIKAKNLDRDDPPITGEVVACLWASCWSLSEHSFATLHRTFGQDDPTARFISESLDGVHVRLLLSKSCPSKATISRSNAVCCTVLTTQRLCSAGQTALQGTCPKIYRIEIKQNHQTALEKKNKLKCPPCLRGCSGQRWPNLRAGALCFFTMLWFPKPRCLPNLQGVRLQTEKVRELMYRCVEMDHLLSAPSTITTSSQGGASQPTIASI